LKKSEILQKTESFVKNLLQKDSTGHDWWHIYRVRSLATNICKNEGGNSFIVELAALLHDVDDWKLIKDSGLQSKTKTWLQSIKVNNDIIDKVEEIINQVSFKGNGVEDNTPSLEAKIVQDADRLDAIGAIGIARAFAYGGSKNRSLHDPEEKPKEIKTFEEYKLNKSSTINHFYEKLLLLKQRMKTTTGKAIAEERHLFMKKYLKQFYSEWEGIL
jgi:uncharacterized protein